MTQAAGNLTKRITGDKITSIIGILTAALTQIVPEVLPADWQTVGLQLVGAASGVALIFSGDKSKTD